MPIHENVPSQMIGAETYSNKQLRHVQVEGDQGKYKISGQVSSNADWLTYSIDDGHRIFERGRINIKKLNIYWVPFQITVHIHSDQLPYSGVLNLNLNTTGDKLHIPLEFFHPSKK